MNRSLKLLYGFLITALTVCLTLAAHNTGGYPLERQSMLEIIEEDVNLTRYHLNRDTLSDKVMQRIASVPRHEFVPDKIKSLAYKNRPLSIGYEQTISQPYIVAIMTDLLELKADQRVLELGTGSGYQAAILSGLVKEVLSIEIIEPLGLSAKARLSRLGYDNVTVKIGDGYNGWEALAPYDAIIVTAATDHIPPPLTKQLKIGGRMIIPVGCEHMTQELLLVTKQAEDKIISRKIIPVRFVPVTGVH
jgi:protein-L-isoaspartate(D-aspartate) O-methyltransferase